jgi:TIR domain/Tetratricopeptide repeat
VTRRGTDFFISHAGRDTAWAEWLAWQLQEIGYTLELDVWDWAPGEDFVARMTAALERTERLLAVCSEAYFTSPFGSAELRAAFTGHAAADGRIVPVLIEPVTVPPLYAPLIHLDLAGLDEATAVARLRTRLGRGRPTAPPPFPLRNPPPSGQPGFAGRLPNVWRMPPRNPRFTGRDGMLTELRRRLRATEPTLMVQALYGLGGVGKTQLALEYAHRFAADYDLVWWIDAEQPLLIADQLAGLAARLELPAGPTVAATVDRLLTELTGRGHWLLIFDNATHPREIADYRPGGLGHVLITSRFPGWGALGGRLEVAVLARAETVRLLQSRIPAMDDELADKLAAELGDLPLAAAQAAAYLEQTDLPPGDYLRRFRTRRADLLTRGDVVGYHGRVDTAGGLSLERLSGADPAAVQLLELAAFLAPEPVALSLIHDQAALLAEPLRTTAADPDALADTLGALVGYSLARRRGDGFVVHRLVQAVIRQQLPPDRQQATAQRAVALLAAASPGEPENPARWATYAQLAPHVLAAGPQVDSSPAGRQLALDTVHYLQARSDSASSHAFCEQVLDRWRTILGPDHPDTLTAAIRSSLALFQLGEAEPARALSEDTLRRCRRALGPDHMTTLVAAAALAQVLAVLEKVKTARALGEDTLQRCRRTLGPDHPVALTAAGPLVVALVLLGATERAHVLGKDTLPRCRQVLGPDHPITLCTASGLTGALSLGEAELASALGEDTLQRSRRVLGADHPTTLYAASVLPGALLMAGEAEPARALSEESLQRCRRVLGPDHPITLTTASILAVALIGLGEAERARALGEDTLPRCHRVLGTEYLLTVWAATALTLALVRVGEAEAARTLGEDTLQRCRRIVGPDHPITLWTAGALTESLIRLGDAEPAHALGQDTLQRCRRLLGPDHPITQYVSHVASSVNILLEEEAHEDHQSGTR